MVEKTNGTRSVNRREFFSKTGKVTAALSAAALAGPAINVLGANNVIRVGIVGPGKRGKYLMNMLTDAVVKNEWKTPVPMKFTAVADIYEGWREEGAAKAEGFNSAMDQEGEIKQYDHHKKLLEDKEVDAVIIATPEHQHAFQLIDALKAGKDVYCEKPMVQNIAQGKKVLEAFKGSDRIVQVGTQRRSVPLFKKANEIIKKGDLGKVTYCEGWWHRNEADGKPGPWAYPIPEDAGPDTVKWDEFLYEAPNTIFDKQRYFQWRSFWDYSNGIGSDLMVHQIDAICMSMGVDVPKSLVSSGGLYRWTDGRVTPDTWSCVMEFEEGFQVNYNARFSGINRTNEKYPIESEIKRLATGKTQKDLLAALELLVEEGILEDKIQDYGIRLCGSKGMIEVFCHWDMNVWPEIDTIWGDKNELEYKNFKYCDSQIEATDQAVRDHMQNWLECVASRKTPNCTVMNGFYGACISNMGTMSYMTGRKIVFDKQKLEATPA